MMTPEESKWMNHLCGLIQNEKDPDKFSILVKELNELFEANERCLTGKIAGNGRQDNRRNG
jgi:hypothetical protein